MYICTQITTNKSNIMDFQTKITLVNSIRDFEAIQSKKSALDALETKVMLQELIGRKDHYAKAGRILLRIYKNVKF